MSVLTLRLASSILLVLVLGSLAANAFHSSDRAFERIALKIVDPPWSGSSQDDLSWVPCQNQRCLNGHNKHKRAALPSVAAPSTSASLASSPGASAMDGNVPSTTETYASTTVSTSSKPTQASSTTRIAPAVSSVPSLIPDPFPQPFDLSLSANLSSSCLGSFASFLTSSTFQTCRPFSLLSTSSAFNQLTKSDLESVTAIISSTLDPSINKNDCESYLNGVGKDLRKNCQADLDKGNAVVNQALIGLGSYQMMRNASALLTPSGTYCFVEALASPKPDDLFYWSLYTGSPIPDATKTCSECTIQLMNIYAGFATNTDLALSKVYASAANITKGACGPSMTSSILMSKTVDLFSTSGSKVKIETSYSFLLISISLFLGFFHFL